MVQSYHVPPHAPFVMLAFLGSAVVVAGLSLAAVAAFAMRRRRMAAWAAASAAVFVAGYAALVLFFALGSRDIVLRADQRKYFCEIDCHLAYSIESVTRARSLGAWTPIRPSGFFYVVTVRTWFDPRTIAPWRGNAALTPNPREVFIVDGRGRRYSESAAGEEALARSGARSTPLMTPLRPGEAYSTRFVFDVPAGIESPRLLLADPPGVETVLLGHENSPLHGKVYFDLEPARATAGL